MTRFAIVALVLAGCGGSDNTTADAPKVIDSASATVQMVTCPATPAATVMTSGFMYAPVTTTINQGQVVKFVMPAEHDAEPGHFAPDGTVADPGLTVNFSETKCLMFTQSGMYGFHCGPHHFDGTIVVQ
jgi:plastocyanin